MTFKELLLVFTGGGLGSILRYSITKFTYTRFQLTFPFGTLMVNILACLILGIAVGMADQKQIIGPLSRLFIVTGFCGGFSTLSAFSNESVFLYQNGNYIFMGLYIFLSILLSIAAILAGQFLVKLN
jgi:CrcB protein